MAQEFLGIGWKYPLSLDEKGQVACSRYEEDVREAIWIILRTSPGERVMRPDFGCGIHDYVFAPNNAQTAELLRFHVEEALKRWEPRISINEVSVQPDPEAFSRLLITIDYQVRSTDNRFNLVYPFYLERSATP